MPNLSQATIIGHLGRDAEQKQAGGQSLVEFSVGVTPFTKGEKNTNWFRCTMWGRRGEAVLPYLTKGTAVLVSGSFQARDYTKKDGTAGYSLEINASELVLLGSKGEQATGAPPAAKYDDDEPPF